MFSTNISEDTDAPLEFSNNSESLKEKYYENGSATEIDTSDLEELRTVYMKCKHVMKKIETKYGHLLNLNEAVPSKRLKRCSETVENELQWYTKKKIVFDDEGRQSTVEKPICVKKIKNLLTETRKSCNITVEYQDVELGLPNNLKELRIMLRDPDLAATNRNKVMAKIKSLKEEYLSEIRLQKADIIKKMKENPDELLDFKGTNIASIPGYP